MPERVTELSPAEPLDPIRRSLLENEVIEQIRTVYDPEIPVNVFDLGLIYAVDVQDDLSVDIKMTLTSPACPVAGTLPGEVEAAAAQTPGVKEVRLELVWDPPFTVDRIPDHIRLELGLL